MSTMMTAPNTLKITVLETATIFEGTDTIYRYDLPGTGIVEGWAVPAVVDQIRDLYAESWPDIEVIIDANESATDMLSRTLLNKGIPAYSIEATQDPIRPQLVASGLDNDDSLDEFDDAPAATFNIIRPKQRKDRFSVSISRFHVVFTVVVILLLGGVVLFINNSMRHDARSVSATDLAMPKSAVVNPADSGSTVVHNDTTQPIAAPQQLVEFENVSFQAPPGFKVTRRDDGLLLATGEDANLRILIGADPVHQVSDDAVHEEVARMVAHDPTLLAQEDEHPRGLDVRTQTYREQPGDGSVVTWVTWVEKQHQMSVGCHSRGQVTVPQRAACRMVVESVQFKG